MNEMTPAERVALDTLRATALAKMSDADFANLETEVASKGLQNLDGWFGAQVSKAVEQVLKHPGHASQASHGGKGKGGSSSSDPAGRANTRREDEAATMVGYGANQTAENMTAHSNEMNQKIYGKDGASKKMTPIDEVELMGINDSLSTAAESLTMLSSGKPQKQYDQIISVRRQLRETRSDAVRQLSPAVRNIAVRAIDKHVAEVDDLLSLHREAWTGVGGTFEKAVEPVVKHPGHANQASHGGGKGGGGSSSAPASSGGSSGKPPEGLEVAAMLEGKSTQEIWEIENNAMKVGVEGSKHKDKWDMSGVGSTSIYFGSGNPVNKLGESHHAIIGVRRNLLGNRGANPKPYEVEVTRLNRKHGGLSGGTRKTAQFATIQEAVAAVDKLIGSTPAFSEKEVLGE